MKNPITVTLQVTKDCKKLTLTVKRNKALRFQDLLQALDAAKVKVLAMQDGEFLDVEEDTDENP